MSFFRFIANSIILFHLINAEQTLQCGDWHVFKDEKCFKVFDNKEIQNYDDANKKCYENEGSSLVTIRSQEEQDFLYNLLKNVHKSVNDVWIGAQFSERRIKWGENVTENYTNWANGYPINDIGYECVLMKMVEPSDGKWLNEPCIRNHSVVCQKQQNWLFSYLQKNVMQLRESFEKYVEHTNRIIENTNSELEKTKQLLIEKTREASPPGTLAYFTAITPPLGWLKANGQQLSRSEYENLFAIIGTTFGSGNGNSTFALPDLRGEFIRGWSDARDVDKERAFGTYQWGSSIPMAGKINGGNYAAATAFQDHWHFAGKTFDDGFESNVAIGQTRNGVLYPNDGQNQMYYAEALNAGSITSWNALKGTRPRNIALLACIKY